MDLIEDASDKPKVPTEGQRKHSAISNWFSKRPDATVDTPQSAISRRGSMPSFGDFVQKAALPLSKSQSFFSNRSSFHSPNDASPPFHSPAPRLFSSFVIEELREIPKIHVKKLDPLQKAVYTGDIRKVKALLQKSETRVDQISANYGMNELHLAIEMEYPLIVRELLTSSDGDTKMRSFANPNIKDVHGRTPLMIVIHCQKLKFSGSHS